MVVFCVEGRMQFMVEGHEYRIGGGDFFAYMPGDKRTDAQYKTAGYSL